jgi:hypothetical protein
LLGVTANGSEVVLVFAGAGASKAVGADSYPTTVEFFQNLPASVTQDPLFNLLNTFLRSRSENGQVDIEVVLWLLRELSSHLRAINDKEDFFGWLLDRSKLATIWGRGYNYGDIRQSAADASPLIETLVGRIDEQVYDFYSRLPEESDLDGNWLKLLRALAVRGSQVEVVTTNYDLVIEKAVEVMAENGESIIDLGWAGDVVRRLSVELWSEARGKSDATRHLPGLLTKLHGSVNWGRKGADIFIGDTIFKGRHDRHAIIYPGFKGRPKDEPFVAFHDHFARVLVRADVALFVGFAFRDEYINELCSRFLSSKTRVVIIDPASMIALPFPESRATRLKAGFDADSVQSFLSLLS